MMMAGPTEFSQEAVRQFMLGRDGTVTNHELVKHFRSWLTHPTEKEAARQRFKEYVNTLATIRQDRGEKFLVLKPQFYPKFDDDDDGDKVDDAARDAPEPSLLDEVMAAYQGSSSSPLPLPAGPTAKPVPPRQHRQLPVPPVQQAPFRPEPPPYRPPPPTGSGSSGSTSSSARSSYAGLQQVQDPGALSLSSYHPVGDHLGLNTAIGPRPGGFRPPAPPAHPHRTGPYSLAPPLPLTDPPTVARSSDEPRAPHPHPYDGGASSQTMTMMMMGLGPAAAPAVAPMSRSSSTLSIPHYDHSSYHQAAATAMVTPPGGQQQHQGAPPVPARASSGPSGRPPQQQHRHHGHSSRHQHQQHQQQQHYQQQQQHQQLLQRRDHSASQPSISSTDSGSMAEALHGPVPLQMGRQQAYEDYYPEVSGPPSLTSRPEKISVKERTKTFNRMASQVELDSAAAPMVKKDKGSSGGSGGGGGGNQLQPAGGSSASGNSRSSSVKRRNSRAATSTAADRRSSSNVARDEDSSSISTMDQTAKQWMVKAAQGDYHTLVKMLRDDPRLAKHRDFVSGYTALHWAAKHGNVDMVKLLAGNYYLNVNQKSHGGYTPLHLACQFGHQDVFDILVKAYGADPHLRDNAGKKPRQYMVVQDQSMGLSMSSDTFRQLKDRRRQRRQNAAGSGKAGSNGGGILRFGSLSVKVKKTTEAFNNYFNSKNEGGFDGMGGGGLGSGLGSGSGGGNVAMGGGASSLPPIMDNDGDEAELSDSERMPPPKFAPPPSVKKRKSKRPGDFQSLHHHQQAAQYQKSKSVPTTPTRGMTPVKEERERKSALATPSPSNFGSDMDNLAARTAGVVPGQVGGSDSDSEYGFDSQWNGSGGGR